MTRAIPIIARRELEKSGTSTLFLIMVTVTHPNITDVITLVLDDADYVYNGMTYYRSAFDLVLLSDTDEPPRARFGFPNVDRASVNRLREVVDPPRVKFEIVPSNYFDLNVEPRVAKAGVTPTAIYTAKSLFLTDIKTDSVRVEGTLRSWDYRQEQWPDKRVTKPLLPAIYER